MEELFHKAIQQSIALKKQPDSIPWKSDQPWSQDCHLWNAEKAEWEPAKLPISHRPDQATSTTVTGLSLFTWNIDFMLPFPEERMKAALAHLERRAGQLLETSTAIVINLQECLLSDLVTIGRNQWVRERFYITDIDDSAWASGLYGTTTLVDRRLQLQSCFRLHYSKTDMERDALFVDVEIPSPSGSGKKVRLCNTHLESLLPDPPLRPQQMRLIAQYMHADGVAGAIVAGDFNAIQPEDDSLHTDNNLKDAYLELGGQPNEDAGYTWGQQALRALRERFGCSRMDKVFFCGEVLKLSGLDRFGADVVADETGGRDQLLSLGFEKAWVTDHLGLNAVFSFATDHHL